MKKEFNTTGTCYPQFHYMMDNSNHLKKVIQLVEYGKYFTMHHPRQFGKTTTLIFLKQYFQKTEEYFPIHLNFQGIDSRFHQSDSAFAEMIVKELLNFFKNENKKIADFIEERVETVSNMNVLSTFISDLVRQFDKKLILLIDEVDASSEYAAFVNFLGMLRTKYLNRLADATFYSIVLAGVHDIKSLKFKLRNPEEAKYNSPWNIAIDFEIDLSFNPKEIAPMLEEYCEAENVTMDIPSIAERLYYHTSGYPFLVSRLCKVVVDKILPQKENITTWTLEDIDASVLYLLKENNTNFDSLINNLENHKDLYKLVSRIVLEGASIPFNQYNPTIYKGILYGVFKRNGRIRIHNRIYEQLIYDYMASKALMDIETEYNYGEHFKLPNNGLDISAALLKFQQFMKEQYSQRDVPFLEREWRLIFLAFISPILNGIGHAFREVQTSEEKRLDVILTYFQHCYIIELKKWYGEKYHEKGLNQLAEYLEIHGEDKGFLIIFDDRKTKSWEHKTIQHNGKEIFAIWV